MWEGTLRQAKIFAKQVKGKDPVIQRARIIINADVKNGVKLISLLTNDMEMDPEEIAEIYQRRRQIELLFKQLKQNFALKYFYGESANAIKIQIWVTLIANLLIMIHKRWLTRSRSFSGLDDAEDYSDELLRLLQSLQSSGERLGISPGKGDGQSAETLTF